MAIFVSLVAATCRATSLELLTRDSIREITMGVPLTLHAMELSLQLLELDFHGVRNWASILDQFLLPFGAHLGF